MNVSLQINIACFWFDDAKLKESVFTYKCLVRWASHQFINLSYLLFFISLYLLTFSVLLKQIQVILITLMLVFILCLS